MILVSVIYPNEADSRFDENYYLSTHIPLVQKHWGTMGLKGAQIVRGVGTPDGVAPPFQIMALFSFVSLADFQKALAAHGSEIMADIANFTNVKPMIQENEPLV